MLLYILTNMLKTIKLFAVSGIITSNYLLII